MVVGQTVDQPARINASAEANRASGRARHDLRRNSTSAENRSQGGNGENDLLHKLLL